MFAKLRALARVFGPGWLLFRLGYSLRRRLGLLGLSMPAYRWEDRLLGGRHRLLGGRHRLLGGRHWSLGGWLRPGIPSGEEEYARWRAANAPVDLFSDSPVLPAAAPWDPQAAVQEAEAVLQGRLRYFSGAEIEIGFPPDWARDPSSGAVLPLDRHWARLSDGGSHDIKYVWEPARFAWAYPLARAYAASGDERYAEGFWRAFEDWMERNQPNHGPGWMDGQECALRLNAACFALAALRKSPATTPRRTALFTLFAAAHAERIRANLGYALSTRSNHTISEAFGLWLAGTLFPELKQAAAYRKLGERLLVTEAGRQLFPDGGYSMYSLNYQRFALQLYCLALRLGELNDQPFPREVYDRLESAADFLYQLVDPDSGEMPEFGSNDGALVLPLNTCGFNDYRPLIQLCQYTATRSRLFFPGPWDEDLFWIFGADALALPTAPPPPQEARAFLDAGVYLLRTVHTAAVLRCV